MAKIEFGQSELEDLISMKAEMKNLETFREGAEVRINALEKNCVDYETEIKSLKKTIEAMARAGSKIAGMAFAVAGAFVYVGYIVFGWLNNATNWKAITDFFEATRSK